MTCAIRLLQNTLTSQLLPLNGFGVNFGLKTPSDKHHLDIQDKFMAGGGWTRSIIVESAILIAIDFEWDFFKLLLLWL